ncbi:HIRAN domain-containing protein [Cereibacter changlensis]|uniref:HIRAN domain-containing protein n=1 Tax=Cereibacter changlensis TaxID=402884 RepID=A0A2W7R3D6_9RHOB|nr:HIRAN domain-containing protein [Cereibacter changlensis]PZX53726.1 HIRAN domain-containing protein [Cereibacter changlensis]
MDRRRVLLAGGGALAALPFAAPAAARAQGVRVLDSYIASRDRFDRTALPGADAVLRLRREPERRFDPRSIRVETAAGEPLGYLPGQSTQVLAALMDAGAQAEARVVEGAAVSIYLHLA